MTDTNDEKLAALLAQDAPPARDAYFRLAVMRRLEQKRFVRQSLWVGALGLSAVALVWTIAPRLPDLTTPAGLTWMALATGGATLVLTYNGWRRLI